MAQRACRPRQHENPPHFPHPLWGMEGEISRGREDGRGGRKELVGKAANLVEGRYVAMKHNAPPDVHKATRRQNEEIPLTFDPCGGVT